VAQPCSEIFGHLDVHLRVMAMSSWNVDRPPVQKCACCEAAFAQSGAVRAMNSSKVDRNQEQTHACCAEARAAWDFQGRRLLASPRHFAPHCEHPTLDWMAETPIFRWIFSTNHVKQVLRELSRQVVPHQGFLAAVALHAVWKERF